MKAQTMALIGLVLGSLCWKAEGGMTNVSSSVVNTNQTVATSTNVEVRLPVSSVQSISSASTDKELAKWEQLGQFVTKTSPSPWDKVKAEDRLDSDGKMNDQTFSLPITGWLDARYVARSASSPSATEQEGHSWFFVVKLGK